MSSFSLPPDSPLDPSIPNLAPEIPELEHVFTETVQSAVAAISKCLPARVVQVVSDQVVNVQPLPQVLYATDTETIDRPVIPNVPVAMSMGKQWGIRTPVAIGDLGLIICADRSIDNYLEGDGSATYDPDDTRMHSMSDAIFYPGLPTKSQQTQEGNTDLVVWNGQMSMRLSQDGTVKLANQNQEMLDLLNQLMTQIGTLLTDLQSAQVLVASFGAAPLTAATIANLTQVQQNVQQIQSDFDTLMGGS